MLVPDGYALRHPTEADLPGAQAVLDAAESHDTGEPRSHEHDLATEWRDPKCHPETDWRIIEGEGGEIAGVGWVWPETAAEVTADHYVHPRHRGRGLGETLLDLIEARAAELPATRPDGEARGLVVWCEDTDVVRRASLDARGHVAVRQFYEMAIDLHAESAAAPWPDGVAARVFRPGLDEHAVYEADEEAFSEHFLFEPRDYDRWRLHHLESTDADPSLWWLAWDGDELAGYVISLESPRGALIGDFAVRQPWRRRGIGRALLAASFATLHARGQTVARLYVDAQNVTDAVGVYESAGMHVSRRFDVMEKRPA